MTHAPDAFLEAVLAAPDEGGPRLVYADWLEERGDPRGEFIRAQIELEQLAEDDPRRWGLDVRVRALAARHGKGWAGPLRRLVKRWRFRRGFVETVTLRADTYLAHAEELFRLAPISSVRLLDAEPHLAALAHFFPMRRLQGLDLRHTPGVTPEWLRTILRASGPTLRWLGLRGTGLCNGAGLRALADCPELVNLVSLDLSDHRRDATVGRPLALGNRGLTRWDDEGGQDWAMSPDAVEAFAHSPHLRNLRSLALGGYGTSFPGESLRDLAESPLMTGLTDLDLRTVRLPRRWLVSTGGALTGAPRTAGLHRLHLGKALTSTGNWDWLHDALFAAGLRELTLDDCWITPARLGNLGLAFPWLHTLRLLGCRFSDGAAALTDPAALPVLRELVLDESPIGSDGLMTLLESPVLPRLKALSFSGRGGLSFVQRVNEATWQKFLSSPRLANLVRLDLGNQYLGDAATMMLAASPHLAALRELVLWRNGIRAYGADAILKSESLAGLELLDLRSNPIPAAVKRELRERFGPGVRYGRGPAVAEDFA